MVGLDIKSAQNSGPMVLLSSHCSYTSLTHADGGYCCRLARRLSRWLSSSPAASRFACWLATRASENGNDRRMKVQRKERGGYMIQQPNECGLLKSQQVRGMADESRKVCRTSGLIRRERFQDT